MPDPIDLSTYSGDALMGCVHARDDGIPLRHWQAADAAGLVRAGQRGDGEWFSYASPAGDRVLAELRALWLSLTPAHFEAMSQSDATPSDAVCAALALHDRERQL